MERKRVRGEKDNEGQRKRRLADQADGSMCTIESAKPEAGNE